VKKSNIKAAKKKMALGKGIASLIQESPQHEIVEKIIGEEEKKVSETGPELVSLNEIKANPNQPRKIFKEKELLELSNSIKENGILQPLIVTKVEKGFELIAGERRLRAAKLAMLDKVPVVITRASDKEKMIYGVIENVQRMDLNCVEEALAYFQLMEEFNLTQEELAKKIGKERSTIANYLRILKLPRNVVEMVQKELLTFGHAKVLATIKDQDKIVRLANICVKESLSVRELEKFSKKKETEVVKEEANPEEKRKLEDIREKLERKTGFHFSVATKKTGKGQISINFTNSAEFNDIFDYLMKI
jgi:ParB family transcriptional regulator, chromosome partitioning protein